MAFNFPLEQALHRGVLHAKVVQQRVALQVLGARRQS
jgi:hypothetical protein